MSICDKRGHYYLPMDRPVSNSFTWSILPPAPERVLYCRRCGHVKPLSSWTPSVSLPTITCTSSILLTNLTTMLL